MPISSNRRHPIYLRLLRPVEPVFSDAVSLVVPSADEDSKEPAGLVYAVTRPCEELDAWAAQLRDRHALDKSYKKDIRVCRLSATPIQKLNLSKVGKIDFALYGTGDARVTTARAGRLLFWGLSLMAVVVDRPGGTAVGFVSFELKWTVAWERNASLVDLEVQPDQAWIAPEFRGRRWGDALAYAVSLSARRHLDHMERSCRWGRGSVSGVAVSVCADVYSSSGESFLRQCAEHLETELSFLSSLRRLEIARFELDVRL